MYISGLVVVYLECESAGAWPISWRCWSCEWCAFCTLRLILQSKFCLCRRTRDFHVDERQLQLGFVSQQYDELFGYLSLFMVSR
ncbi:hypothetical protein O9992_19085 [Vibrio lentus]|nr:hypothetical protein [Vibrio lentus]